MNEGDIDADKSSNYLTNSHMTSSQTKFVNQNVDVRP